jgi:hypothetical protein
VNIQATPEDLYVVRLDDYTPTLFFAEELANALAEGAFENYDTLTVDRWEYLPSTHEWIRVS